MKIKNKMVNVKLLDLVISNYTKVHVANGW